MHGQRQTMSGTATECRRSVCISNAEASCSLLQSAREAEELEASWASTEGTPGQSSMPDDSSTPGQSSPEKHPAGGLSNRRWQVSRCSHGRGAAAPGEATQEDVAGKSLVPDSRCLSSYGKPSFAAGLLGTAAAPHDFIPMLAGPVHSGVSGTALGDSCQLTAGQPSCKEPLSPPESTLLYKRSARASARKSRKLSSEEQAGAGNWHMAGPFAKCVIGRLIACGPSGRSLRSLKALEHQLHPLWFSQSLM